MASQTTDPGQDQARLSLRGRIRRKLGHLLTPTARRVLNWCQANQAPSAPSEIEIRLARLEERAVIAEWGREALVERINADDLRIHTLEAKLAAIEPLVEHAYWGREALVGRLNETDYRIFLIENRFEGIQTQIDEHVPVPRALGFDSMAMGRRLAAIEDQLEIQSTQNGQSHHGQATLVPFRPSRAEGIEPTSAAG